MNWARHWGWKKVGKSRSKKRGTSQQTTKSLPPPRLRIEKRDVETVGKKRGKKRGHISTTNKELAAPRLRIEKRDVETVEHRRREAFLIEKRMCNVEMRPHTASTIRPHCQSWSECEVVLRVGVVANEESLLNGVNTSANPEATDRK